MAYINGAYKHHAIGLEVEVLEPTKDEIDYSRGRTIQVDWDSMNELTTKEFGLAIHWLRAVNAHIKKNFDRKGRKRATYQEFEYHGK